MTDIYFISGIANGSGATVKQIREWTKKGYLGDIGYIPSGDRTVAVYTEKHLKIASDIVRLKDEGYTLQTAIIIAQEQNAAAHV